MAWIQISNFFEQLVFLVIALINKHRNDTILKKKIPTFSDLHFVDSSKVRSLNFETIIISSFSGVNALSSKKSKRYCANYSIIIMLNVW